MTSPALASAEEKSRLSELRLALLRMHKALLEVQRIEYERYNGRVEGGLALFNLVANDAAFAWLRPLTTLIVQFDEKVEGKEPLAAADAKLLREEARALMEPDRYSAGFQGGYDRAIQGTPDVLIMHTKLLKLL